MSYGRKGYTDPYSRKRQENPAAGFLTLARIVGFVAAISAGLAVGLGSYTDIVASDGPANFILPFVIAIAVALGLGAGWHVVLAMGSVARSPQARAMVLSLGLGLAVIGAGTSAWFLAAKIGGSTAVSSHQQIYLTDLNEAEQKIAANHARERVLIAVAGRGQSALENTALDEGNFGAVSGKAGFKTVFSALKNAAGGLQDTQSELQRLADRTDGLLSQARHSIDEAGKAIAARDDRKFEDAIGVAVSRLGDANRIRLSNTLLGAGDIDASGPAATNVANVVDGMRRAVRSVSSELRPVTIPAYVPMDAKTAVVTYPQPLPWLMAILIECLPLLMLGIMMAVSVAHETQPSAMQPVRRHDTGSDISEEAIANLRRNLNGQSRRSNRHRDVARREDR